MNRWDFSKLFSISTESEENAESELWQAFAKSREPSLRGALIEANIRLVFYVVHRLRCFVPPSMEREDMVSCGLIGLIEAVDRFDPKRGTAFSTFAVKRIRGAVFDGICQYSGLTRYGYTQRRKQTGNAGLPDTRADLLDESFCSVRDQPLWGEQDVTDPELRLAEREEQRWVDDAVARLPELQQKVIFQHYYGNQPLRKIAVQLQYSPSWVGRLHQTALCSLRGLLSQEDGGSSDPGRARGGKMKNR